MEDEKARSEKRRKKQERIRKIRKARNNIKTKGER
jgi:hypothetical protein